MRKEIIKAGEETLGIKKQLEGNYTVDDRGDSTETNLMIHKNLTSQDKKGQQQYETIQNEITRKCRKTKEDWLRKRMKR